MNHTRSLLVALVLTAVLGACGGDGGGERSPAAAATPADVVTATPAGEPAAVQPGGEASAAVATKPDAKGAVTSEPAAGPTATTVKPARQISGVPDKTCVHPGETQGLTVRGGNPEAYVIYDTVYSNKTNDLSAQYGSGAGTGSADRDGVFHTTWVLKPNVPPGETYVTFATKAGDGLRRGYTVFTIAPLGSPCP